jgi:hypothetical protein
MADAETAHQLQFLQAISIAIDKQMLTGKQRK